MNGATRLAAIALGGCLTCQIVTAQVATPNPAMGIVRVSKVSMDADTLTVSGSARCAAATVQVAVIGLGVESIPDPTVTVRLAASRTTPSDVTADIEGLTDSHQVTSSPGIFTFQVCATGLPSGAASGAITLQATVLKVSPETHWKIGDPQSGAATATLTVSADPERPAARPELKLIVTPVNLQMAKQNGEAVFEFDVAASNDFAGTVVGRVRIAQPQNPDGVELVEGTRNPSLSFRLGAGQKLSDAHHLRYRIRTSGSNQHEGVLTYGLTLSAVGDQFTLQDAAQQVTVQVGGAAQK